jgi:hypothetical protein
MLASRPKAEQTSMVALADRNTFDRAFDTSDIADAVFRTFDGPWRNSYMLVILERRPSCNVM